MYLKFAYMDEYVKYINIYKRCICVYVLVHRCIVILMPLHCEIPNGYNSWRGEGKVVQKFMFDETYNLRTFLWKWTNEWIGMHSWSQIKSSLNQMQNPQKGWKGEYWRMQLLCSCCVLTHFQSNIGRSIDAELTNCWHAKVPEEKKKEQNKKKMAKSEKRIRCEDFGKARIWKLEYLKTLLSILWV